MNSFETFLWVLSAAIAATPICPSLELLSIHKPSMTAGADLTVFAAADWATGAPDLRGEMLNEGTEKLESTGGPWSSKVM